MSTDTRAVTLDDCYFNFRKGVWETHPLHWVESRIWIVVAFPSATTLDRGVAHRQWSTPSGRLLSI